MKKREKRRIAFKAALIVMALVCVCAPLLSPFGYGTAGQKRQEYNDIQDQIDDTKKKISEGEKQSKELQTQISAYQSQIRETQVEINALTIDLNATKERITTTLEELAVLQNSIDEQNAALMSRLRAMYKQGDAGLLSVLLGSSSMSELLTNVDMMKRIYQSDADLIEQLGNQYAEVDKKKNELVELKADLEKQQADLDAKKSALSADMSSVTKLKNQVDSKNAAYEKELDELDKQAESLRAEILRLQSGGSYTGGAMGWPCRASSRITDPFGMRLHPFYGYYKLHTGIDIGCPAGRDILAAADGKVIKTVEQRTGYGYYVMIDHGGGIVTLYAHCSKILVKTGDRVMRGDTIALVGSTGMSTGPHIHFEVRVNGNYKNPLDYVTPGKF